jgi:hypothetical protein
LRSKRWQAAPNDRQLAALLEFETAWRGRRAPLDPEHLAPHGESAAGAGQAAG